MSWSFVQIAQIDQTGAGTISIAFTNNNALGNTIIAIVFWADTTSNPTFTDSNGNVYRQVGSTFRAPGFTGSGQIWITNRIVAGPNTVSLNNAGTFPTIHALEYKGVSSPPKYQIQGADINGPSPGIVSFIPIGGADLLVAGLFPNNDDGTGPAPGCTQRGVKTGTNGSMVADRLPNTPIGTFSVGCTFASASEPYICLGAAFQASGELLRPRVMPVGL